jgi:hypothetical protein
VRSRFVLPLFAVALTALACGPGDRPGALAGEPMPAYGLERGTPGTDADGGATPTTSGLEGRDAAPPLQRAPDGQVETADGRTPDTDAGPSSSDTGVDTPVVLDAVFFTDVTKRAGIDFSQGSDFDCDPVHRVACDYEAPITTGGAAVGDFDADGLVDLYLTRYDGPDALYRNIGDGEFVDVADAAGLAVDLPTNGAGFADVDNDGDLDLYTTTVGDSRNYLFINDGAGHYSEDAKDRKADTGSPPGLHQGYGVAFGDYDLDGFLDIHTSEWRSRAQSLPSYSRLLRNRGAQQPGRFDDVTKSANVDLSDLDPLGAFAFSSSFVDLDGDDHPDLAVTADFGTSRLFWNDGDGDFVAATASAGVGTDENGMGGTFGDYDGDGLLDWFVAAIFDPDDTCASEPCRWGASGNRLYHNDGNRRFSDATDAAGVRAGGWGWGTAFFDYDNDGDLDLVMTNGMVGEGPITQFERDPMRLWQNDGGRFHEVARSAGLDDRDDGKGLAVVDYDEDGDLDVLVVTHAGSPHLFRNDGGNANGWLRIRVAGTDSNRDGVGARVTVRRTTVASPMLREVVSGSGFLGQSELVQHFGLGPGSEPVAEVRVRFPKSGREVVLSEVTPNQTIVVTEPAID